MKNVFKKFSTLNSQLSTSCGQSLVELIIIMGLLSILLPALITGLISSREGKPQESRRTEAINLLKETNEAIRNVREKGWTTFAVNGTFYPRVAADNSWELASGSATLNGFTRQVVISDVQRDASGVIVPSGGTVDPSTKKGAATVSWTNVLPYSVSSTAYLTRYLDNLSYTETTQAQFNAGTKTATAVTNTSGGEVVLGSGGTGDWCAPATPSGSMVLDLPKNGVANAVSAIEGSAFAGTGENASGVSFAKINISNNPPAATLADTFDGYKTNDVFGETNYAYLATDNNAKEIVIINLNSVINGKYQEAGYFNAPPHTDGKSVFVFGNVGYVTTADKKLYSFDLASKSGSRPLLDSDGITLDGNGSSVVVNGNYAYIALANSFYELEIVDISNPSNLTSVSRYNVDIGDTNSFEDGVDVYVNTTGTRAYLAINEESLMKEFFILNIENKSNPSIVGSYEANGMSPKGVTLTTGNRAILVGTGAEEYQVINISNEASPTRCGGLNVDTGVHGVAGVVEQDGDAYAYIITGDVNAEFKIIAGGPGGGYASNGAFESQAFDAGSTTGFNRFAATVTTPINTEIKMHVAVADAVSGSCSGATFTFLGPNGDPAAFFTPAAGTINGVIPFTISGSYRNPGRCFRYKAFLSTTDPSATPVLYDVTVNYSP